MLYAVLLGILLFFSGWGIAFVVSFVCAPAALDAKCQETITKLSQELAIPDADLAARLTPWLEQVGPNGREIIKFMLLYNEEVERGQLESGTTLSQQAAFDAVQVCLKQRLIKMREVRDKQYSHIMLNIYYWVPDGFRSALKRMLFARPQNSN
jgi:hypothetical protein